MGMKNKVRKLIKKQKKVIGRLLYRRKYKADDIIHIMQQMGMESGSIVFIHSSMTEFYNYLGTAEELISKIIEAIGPEGTLMMPAYPINKSKLMRSSDDHVKFDVLKTPSAAGYLTEVFRKYPGVKRSINLQHSVCAYGKLAEYFVSEHNNSITTWDEKSPYYKMSQMKTLVFSFGLPKMIGTFIHCTESILRNRYEYFSLFFKKEVTYNYIDYDRNIHSHTFLTHGFTRKTNKKFFLKELKKEHYKKYKLSNLRVSMVEADYTLNLFLSFADKGITLFKKPSPKSYIVNGRFIKTQSHETV